MGSDGVEPSTSSLSEKRSTDELTAQFLLIEVHWKALLTDELTALAMRPNLDILRVTLSKGKGNTFKAEAWTGIRTSNYDREPSSVPSSSLSSEAWTGLEPVYAVLQTAG